MIGMMCLHGHRVVIPLFLYWIITYKLIYILVHDEERRKVVWVVRMLRCALAIKITSKRAIERMVLAAAAIRNNSQGRGGNVVGDIIGVAKRI